MVHSLHACDCFGLCLCFRKEEAAFTPCFRRLLGLFGRFWTPILDPFWTPILGVNFDTFWAL